MDNPRELTLPSKAVICEVAPRDGFQAITNKWIATEDKISMIRLLSETGVKNIEITSFVHPKAIPQLKDASEVVQACQDLTQINFRALVPNIKGAERAIVSGIKRLN